MTRIASGTRGPTLESDGAAPAETARVAPQQGRGGAAPAQQGARVAPQEATSTGSSAWRKTAAASDVAQPAPAQTPAHRTANATAFAADLARWEGNTRHMYVDTRGHVTTGIGHQLRDANAATALPWLHRATGAPATPAEIRAAFTRVAAQPAGQHASRYERASDLVLPSNVARDMAAARLQHELLPGIRRLCPGFDRYPHPAQRALVDMAYNLGVAGLGRFSNMLDACERGDFAAAAGESNRRTCRDERNDATRELLLAAAHLTNAVHALLREVRP
jgi:GH24 family phage-related lysozyme (muramidase)